ncbi:omptin family outer membrane protease [Breznakiellaceae bacterium SP9]
MPKPKTHFNILAFFSFVIIYFLFVLPKGAYTEEPLGSYALSVSTMAGFLYGHAEEIVYKDAVSDDYLSELLWDLKPLWFYGAAIDVYKANPLEDWGFFAGLNVKYAIPRRSGTMEDRDWQAVGHRSLTNYSAHDAFVDELLFFTVSTGTSHPLFSVFALRLFAEFSYRSISWDAKNGYWQYASQQGGDYNAWDPSLPKNNVSGKVISYEQLWIMAAPGLALLADFYPFTADLSFRLSPLIYGVAKDTHWLRALRFDDYVSGGLLIEPQLTLSLDLSEHRRLSWYTAYRYLRGARGESYLKYDNSNQWFQNGSNAGGAGYAFWDCGLSFAYVF